MSVIYKLFRGFLLLAGLFLVASIICAFLSIPSAGIRWLAAAAERSSDTDYIVLLPGGGVPNTETYMRTRRAARESAINHRAKIIITQKMDRPYKNSSSWRIRDELVLRGVDPALIIFERRATSTAGHAKYIKEDKIGDIENDSYLLVTSEYHVMRSVLVFRAQGFKNIYAAPIMSISDDGFGENKIFRYGVWSELQKEIIVIREMVAMAWYKLSGAI